jgi:hypothetical protein
MGDEAIRIKPDNARFMGTLLIGISAACLVVGWLFAREDWAISGIVSRIFYPLGILFGYVGASSFDGTITIYPSKISQRRWGLDKSIEFDKILNLQFTSSKNAHSLIIKGADVAITMNAAAFERATSLRVRRTILARAPNVEHNLIASDDHYRAKAENA